MLGLPGEPLPGQQVRAYDTAAMVRYVKSSTPRTAPGSLSVSGSGGSTRRPIRRATWQWPLTAQEAAWPFKVYNTSQGATGQVQINGGDGFVASLNGFVANVNGSPNNVQSGSPAKHPQLPITGNGVVYAYAVPATPGTASSLAPGSGTLDVYYGGALPAPDSANPATYFPLLLATITNYAVTSGVVSFTVSNAFNVGPSTLIYCGGAIQVY